MKRHVRKCCGRAPPGNEIYRSGNLSVFEVNGRGASKAYCQNLCLLAKMFLDHKTLYYDTDTFLFYVLVEWHPVETLRPTRKRNATLCNYSLVGYFSKEKQSPAGYNVSCILTLPNHQRKGYGHFLIDFSYLLSRIEGRPSTPEKPLSDLGLLSYTSYWTHKVMAFIHGHQKDPYALNVAAICDETGMTVNDVLGVLEHHSFVRWHQQEDGGGGVGGEYEICLEEGVLEAHWAKGRRAMLQARPSALRWSPYTCPR